MYHGFPVLADVEVEGFTLGMITDFEADPGTNGDAFVIAPDGGRAGLAWEVAEGDAFTEASPLEACRRGVWAVTLPHPMTSRANARRNLRALLPKLRPRREAWREQFTGTIH